MAEGMPPEELARHKAVLQDAADVETIVVSAMALAGSEDREALIALTKVLVRPGFLARLEGEEGPRTEQATNLADVMIALKEHPTEFTGRLCERLYGDAGFRELPARVNPLLHALAAVKPVTPRAAELFRETSQVGYAQVNGPILLANGEPPALDLFAELITGSYLEAYEKVEILHRALLPVRHRVPVVQMCIRLTKSGLEETVLAGLVESLFDHRSKEWFGPAMYVPMPPDWNEAPETSLELLSRLGERLLSQSLPPRVLGAVRATREELIAILRRRRG